MTRVAIVARSPTVRTGLAGLLGSVPGLVVLETAALPGELAAVAESAEADVVLLALEPGERLPLPLAVAPDAVTRTPAVVVLGPDGGEPWYSRAVRAGARGALPRTAAAEQIAAAVAAAAAGLVAIPAESATMPRTAGRVDAPAQPLTPRELEVLGMLAEGLGNKAIGARLRISEHTVKTHVEAVFGKLGVSTRAEAVASGVRAGLIML